MENDKPKMKLFVAGELSSDPREWTHISPHELIIAENELQALELTDRGNVVEVCMDHPALL